jgi:2-polyprenyl-3-methyl-5-hydroxy-6-metoxy-1,4-benzoquinol methylase
MAELPQKSASQLEEQRHFWNEWNTTFRTGDWKRPEVNVRQARMVIEWLQRIGRKDLRILEIGCSSGWLCAQLAEYGHVVGTDISDEVLRKSTRELPQVKFVAGDFLALEFAEQQFDVVVTLEVLSHVVDQHAFVEKIARLLKPGGYLALATQNRVTLSRWSNVQPVAPGQIRKWVDAKTLRSMLARHFEILEFKSIMPVGDRGFLRLVNSYKVNKILAVFLSQTRLDAWKERRFLGHTLMALAQEIPMEMR